MLSFLAVELLVNGVGRGKARMLDPGGPAVWSSSGAFSIGCVGKELLL